jgi:hypothetical protein
VHYAQLLVAKSRVQIELGDVSQVIGQLAEQQILFRPAERVGYPYVPILQHLDERSPFQPSQTCLFVAPQPFAQSQNTTHQAQVSVDRPDLEPLAPRP